MVILNGDIVTGMSIATFGEWNFIWMENIVDNEYKLLKIQRLYNMVAKADWDYMLC